MKKADDSVIQAIVGLKHDELFRELVKWFRESLEDQRLENDVQCDDVRLRQGQGRAQELNDFLKTVAEADAIHQQMNGLDT
jgi:hypothetical protein